MATAKIKAGLLVGYGINCEQELAAGFSLAGAQTEYLHVTELLAKPEKVLNYSIFALPGGFSFGDDIASGKVMAVLLKSRLEQVVQRFINEGKLILGICNGAQIGIKWGLFPSAISVISTIQTIPDRPVSVQTQQATLTYNASGHFECRWISAKVTSQKCVFTQGLGVLHLPVAHGEGRFVADAALIREWETNEQLILRYCHLDGSPAHGEYPVNPNGSVDDVAGVCDTTGRVLLLMPHPERNLSLQHHPAGKGGDGLKVLVNAVDYARKELGD